MNQSLGALRTGAWVLLLTGATAAPAFDRVNPLFTPHAAHAAGVPEGLAVLDRLEPNAGFRGSLGPIVAVSGDTLYVTSPSGHRIGRFQGGVLAPFLEAGEALAPFDLADPIGPNPAFITALCALNNGDLLVADSHRRVHRVSPAADASAPSVRRFAGSGEQGSQIHADDPARTQLGTPSGLLELRDGSVLILDDEHFRVLRVHGDTVEVFAGTGEAGSRIDPQSAAATPLRSPYGLALLADGSVLISDHGNDRVLRIQDKAVSIFAGRGPGAEYPGPLLQPGAMATLPDGSVLIQWGEHATDRFKDGARTLFAGPSREDSHRDAEYVPVDHWPLVRRNASGWQARLGLSGDSVPSWPRSPKPVALADGSVLFCSQEGVAFQGPEDDLQARLAVSVAHGRLARVAGEAEVLGRTKALIWHLGGVRPASARRDGNPVNLGSELRSRLAVQELNSERPESDSNRSARPSKRLRQ